MWGKLLTGILSLGSTVSGIFSGVVAAIAGLMVEKMLLKVVAIAAVLAVLAGFTVCVHEILDQFLPGGALSSAFPGGQKAAELMSYVLPSNTGLCITALLCCYSAVYLVKWSKYFIDLVAS